ncbi:MAG: HalOD1 output domain-containing protein [Haloferacaceae archaeon]
MSTTPRVLHVDDDPDILSVSRATSSETEAFELHTARSASEALDELSSCEYAAVVTDSLVTDEGVPLPSAIRARNPTVPILLFTGVDRATVADELDTGAVTAYVQKGQGSLSEVLELVDRLVSHTDVHAASARAEWVPLGVHDWSGPTELGTTVVQLLSDHADEDINERAALYESVDPDAMENLLGPRLDGTVREDVTVQFTFEGYELSVSSDGVVAARPKASDFLWLADANTE